jgi:hypothetical protein
MAGRKDERKSPIETEIRPAWAKTLDSPGASREDD